MRFFYVTPLAILAGEKCWNSFGKLGREKPMKPKARLLVLLVHVLPHDQNSVKMGE